MNLDDLLKIGGAALTIGGLLWRAASREAAIRQDIANIRLEMARDYVSANAMREIAGQLGDQIARLGDRLDRVLEKNS